MASPFFHDKPFSAFSQTLEEMSSRGRRRRLAPCRVEGPFLITATGERLINFGGNDYLGVLADKLLWASSQHAGQTAEEPTSGQAIPGGASASALVCGWTPHHERLATAIARAEAAEAAVVFPSGYAACSGTVATLCRKNDLILSDQLNHASLIDGCRASPAHCEVYPHCDVERIESLLRSQRDQFENVWIVTDGVFSMDGDCAPLADLVRLAARYDAELLVDEAHGTGVLGPHGGGLCEALELQDKIPIRIGTLSKAIGHQGGFVAAPQVVIDYLVQFCRTLIFSTALAPPSAAGACTVIERMRDWSPRREHLAHLAQTLRQRIGCELTGLDASIPIVPIVVGEDQRALALSNRLRERGFYVPAIRPPTVPEGTARLRVSLTAAHHLDQVESLVEALANC